MFCIIVMAGPEKAEAKKVKQAKLPIPTQKLGYRQLNATHGIARALPIMGTNAFAQSVFFSYLSAMIPPTIPEARPRVVLIRALAKEYEDLKSA